MKTATIFAVLAIVVCMGLDAFGQPACKVNICEPADMSPFPNFPPVPSGQTFPTGNVPAQSSPSPVAKMRITSIAPPVTGKNIGTDSVPSARVSLATIAPVEKADATEVVATTTPDETAASDTLDPALAGLVGTWSAVSRFGDGELSTVELQLDDRGWAKLTLPGPDGKRSTIERRVKLEEQELKLTGPEKALSLGKLIDFSARQMVLEQTTGQVTFVRI